MSSIVSAGQQPFTYSTPQSKRSLFVQLIAAKKPTSAGVGAKTCSTAYKIYGNFIYISLRGLAEAKLLITLGTFHDTRHTVVPYTQCNGDSSN